MKNPSNYALIDEMEIKLIDKIVLYIFSTITDCSKEMFNYVIANISYCLFIICGHVQKIRY